MAPKAWWTRIGIGVAVATLLVGCGDDEDSASPTTTVAPTTSTTLSQVQLDKQKSGRVSLTTADLPGFTVDPPDPSNDGEDLEAAANACVKNNPVLVRLGEENDPRGASAPDFSKGENQSVSSSTTFGETEDEARSAFTDLGAASFPACFSTALTTELRKNTTFSNVSTTTAKLPALTVGDQSIGYRSTVRARVSSTQATFYFDFTFLRSGRAVSVLEGFSLGSAFPEAERVRLAGVLVGRMAAP